MTTYFVYSTAPIGSHQPTHIDVIKKGDPVPIYDRSEFAVHSIHDSLLQANHERDKLRKTNGIVHRSQRYSRLAVHCLTNGKTYRTASEAAIDLDIANSVISHHLNNPRTYPTAKGYVLKRKEPT